MTSLQRRWNECVGAPTAEYAHSESPTVGGKVMPTGETPGLKGSIASPQDGSYRAKNIHGLRHGPALKHSVSNRSISFSHENARYLDGVNKGHKSAVVNRALDFYRHNPDSAGLWESFQHLERVIQELHQEIDEITSSGEIPDDEAKKVSPSRGIWGKLKFW